MWKTTSETSEYKKLKVEIERLENKLQIAFGRIDSLEIMVETIRTTPKFKKGDMVNVNSHYWGRAPYSGEVVSPPRPTGNGWTYNVLSENSGDVHQEAECRMKLANNQENVDKQE